MSSKQKTIKPFTIHHLLFTLRLLFTVYHGKQKTDHRKRTVNGKLKTVKATSGFTVVELTIATAVFAAVLLVGLVSFLGVGKVYYKGVSLTQTQAVAQQILTQLTADIQFAPTIVTAKATGDGSSQFLCLGNIRYTFNLYQKVDLADHDNQSKFGLLRDSLPGSTGCNSPFGDGAVSLNNPTELLGNKMRLAKLNLTPAKNAAGGNVTDLWNLDVKVAYGDDDVLTNPGVENVTCDANLTSTQFCSVNSQTTTVSRGL